MLQNNALAGWLMLIGIALHSWQMAVWAICGLAVSTLAACAKGYPETDVRNGLFGFNGALVGLAAGLFLQPGAATVCLMIAASVLSTWLTRLFSLQRVLSGYTAPFILAVWLMLGLCHALFPDSLQPTSEAVQSSPTLQVLQSISFSIGQVMFQGNLLTGLFFLLAIAIHSRMSALYTLWGALLSIALAWICGMETAAINEGLMGYNGVLCAIAFAPSIPGVKTSTCFTSHFFLPHSGICASILPSFLKASIAIALSVALQYAGQQMGLITLTAPFVLAVWTVKLFEKLGEKTKNRQI